MQGLIVYILWTFISSALFKGSVDIILNKKFSREINYALPNKKEEFDKFFIKISHALEDVKIFIDFDIRSGGEYKNKGFYLGHSICRWEIVQDSLNAFVLVPKDLLPEEKLLTK